MKNPTFILSLFLSFALFSCGIGEKKGDSQTKGNSQSDLSQHIDAAVEAYIDSCYLPNAVCLVMQDGNLLHCKAYGYSNIEDSSRCTTDHLFRLASQTKAITVVAFMQLYEQGLCQLEYNIALYLPEFAGQDITIWHLLTHTAGYCYDGDWEEEYTRQGALAHKSAEPISLAENTRRMAGVKRKHPAGEAFTYANNTDIVGRLIEVLSGEEYVTYIQRHILQPLNMHHTYFYLPDSLSNRLVTLYAATDEGLQRISEDPNLYKTGSYPSPSAGLVGTIEDYAQFCQMILNEGELNGIRILQPETIHLMQQNHVGQLRGKIGFGFAWDVFFENQDYPNGLHSGCMRWGGMYGTDYVIDPERRLITIFYTNCRPQLAGHNSKSMFLQAVGNTLNFEP